ncbi:MAG: hypothetical protein Q9204_004656 [Flavoplaca sp. TL-2023a]
MRGLSQLEITMEGHYRKDPIPKSHNSSQLEVPSSQDPRDFESEEQWRDTALRLLRMQHLRVDFFTIRLDTMMRDIKARFTYTVRPLEEGEEFEPEYSGPPIVLEDDLRLEQDGDIEEVGAEDGGIEQEIDEAEQAENRAFLLGGGTMIKKTQVPQSKFGPEYKQKKLEQHEGIDVMAPGGLRKWQELVINKITYANGPNPGSKKRFRSKATDKFQRLNAMH